MLLAEPGLDFALAEESTDRKERSQAEANRRKWTVIVEGRHLYWGCWSEAKLHKAMQDKAVSQDTLSALCKIWTARNLVQQTPQQNQVL